MQTILWPWFSGHSLTFWAKLFTITSWIRLVLLAKLLCLSLPVYSTRKFWKRSHVVLNNPITYTTPTRNTRKAPGHLTMRDKRLAPNGVHYKGFHCSYSIAKEWKQTTKSLHSADTVMLESPRVWDSLLLQVEKRGQSDNVQWLHTFISCIKFASSTITLVCNYRRWSDILVFTSHSPCRCTFLVTSNLWWCHYCCGGKRGKWRYHTLFVTRHV